MNTNTLDKIDQIIANNEICCLTCKHFKVTALYAGMCKNAKSNLYLSSVGFYSVVAPILGGFPRTTRSGKCLVYKSYIDGKTNEGMLVKCNYCGSQKPYKDFYDKFAYFCTYDCRLKFNDEFNEKWLEEVNRKNKYYYKKVVTV